MSAPTLDPPLSVDGTGHDSAPDAVESAAAAISTVDASGPADLPVSIHLTAAAGLLSAAAAGWMCGGIFRGSMARGVGVTAAILGSGIVAVSFRTRRPSAVQALVLPLSMLGGALLAMAGGGGGAGLPALVVEALRGGGISQPPVPFDPGWRFLLVVAIGSIAASASALGIGTNRPKLAVMLPVPVIVGAALVQPGGATMVSALGALVLAVGATAVAFGVDLSRSGATSGQFEVRRLARSGGIIVGLVAAVVALSQLGFLFPDTADDQVIPPKRPEVPQPSEDRVLFTVRADRQVPWRLGVLDVYREGAWMTPPFDTKRLALVPPTGEVPFGGPEGKGRGSTVLMPPGPPDPRLRVTFTMQAVEGHVVPGVANPLALPERDVAIEYDPRTQALRLPDGRPRRGQSYTIEAAAPATREQLASAAPSTELVAEYLEVPEAPTEVADLIGKAPTANLFDRLQFVRNAYFQSVVASGPGNPVDVPPARVAEILGGADASPFEITAAEVLLARWAGVPARLGYGYFGGDKDEASGSYAVRPKHGATWLEAHFEGYGWIPIVGTPPKAKSSLRPEDKNEDPTVRPSEELALLVYVPIRLQSLQLVFTTVRYWVVRTAPLLALALVVGAAYPGVLKMIRRWRRRRWAAEGGHRDRIAVAYAELRDVINDFNIGDPSHSPLEFVSDLEPDVEHAELAWLVTRGLWGDLRRDLQEADAIAAEEMATSLTRRCRKGNPGLARAIAFCSRASLRDPYSPEIPNLWPGWTRPRPRGIVAALRRAVPALVRRPAAVSALLAVLLVAGCVQAIKLVDSGPPLLERHVPDALDSFSFVRERTAEESFAKAGDASLVRAGRVYSIHQGDVIQGSIQQGWFKGGLGRREDDVRRGLLRSIGAGQFKLIRIGRERVHVLTMPEQRIFLWFAPEGTSYQLMVTRQSFDGADRLFVALLGAQRGENGAVGDVTTDAPIDPRRRMQVR